MLKACPHCQKKWTSLHDLLTDPEVSFRGYQSNFEHCLEGFFLFNHNASQCKTTMAIKVELFKELSLAEFENAKIIPGGEGCMGFCVDQESLELCQSTSCAGVAIRKLIQLIRSYNQVVVPEKKLKPNILVVEDDEKIRELIINFLEACEYKVTAASCGKKGFDLASINLFDLVISDLLMSDGDGLSLLDSLRAVDVEHPKFILMTGFDNLTPEEALQRGAQRVLNKPFTETELLTAVNEVLGFKS